MNADNGLPRVYAKRHECLPWRQRVSYDPIRVNSRPFAVALVTLRASAVARFEWSRVSLQSERVLGEHIHT
jgi:hypothetical protein